MLEMKYINETADSEETTGEDTEIVETAGEETYPVDFKKVGRNVVELKGDFPIQTTGFVLSRAGMEDNFDYSGYTTIYREIDGGVQFSNDGSAYVEPEPVPEPELEPYVPTLEEVKANKIAISKALLARYLEQNPLESVCHGGKLAFYSVTEEKQNLMMSQYMTYQIEKQINPNAVLTWNEKGKSCEAWTEEEFLQLIMEVKAYVYPLVSAQQTLEEQINGCATIEEVKSITIDYGAVQTEVEDETAT